MLFRSLLFERAPRPTQTLSGPIPTNLDSLLGGFEAAKYTGAGGRNSRAMVEAEVWQPILDEFVIEGITTTIELHKVLLHNKKFLNSDFNVSWLDNEKVI